MTGWRVDPPKHRTTPHIRPKRRAYDIRFVMPVRLLFPANPTDERAESGGHQQPGELADVVGVVSVFARGGTLQDFFDGGHAVNLLLARI
jgi:hypothetical protein